MPAVRGLFGLEANVAEKRIRVAPQLPAHWSFARFSRYVVAGDHLSGEIRQQPGRASLTLQSEGRSPVDVGVEVAIPLATTRVRRVLLNGKPAKFSTPKNENSPVMLEFPLAGRAEIVVEYDGGVAIVPPAADPQPGRRTASLKVLAVTSDVKQKPRQIELVLAGLGGQTYALDLVTTEASLTAEGAVVRKTENGYRLEIRFEGSQYVTRPVRLRF